MPHCGNTHVYDSNNTQGGRERYTVHNFFYNRTAFNVEVFHWGTFWQQCGKKTSLQGCAPRQILGSLMLWMCGVQGTQHLSATCMQKLRFPSCLRAKFKLQGPLGTARAHPCSCYKVDIVYFYQTFSIISSSLCSSKHVFPLYAVHITLNIILGCLQKVFFGTGGSEC